MAYDLLERSPATVPSSVTQRVSCREPPVMAREIPENHPLHRLFRGLAESTFLDQLGIGDPSLVGYVAGLLARFVPTGGIWAIHDAQGRRVVDVTAMVAEAEAADDPE